MFISQQPIIPANATGLMHFWQNGVQATNVHMLYTAHAMDAGMPPNEVVSCLRAQVKCLSFITAETKSVGSFLNTDPSAQSSVSIFRHDALNGLMTVLNSWLDLFKEKERYLHEWKKHVKSAWGPRPNLRRFLENIVEAQLPERSLRDVKCYADGQKSVRFRSQNMVEGAKVILGNLIDNGIKYSSYGDKKIEISQEGARITYSDNGIGMAQEFADRLGGEERLREGRAKGVEGSGIGWTSIGRTMRELGWTWKIESAWDKGTEIAIYLKAGDLVPVEDGATGPKYSLSPGQLIPTDEIVRSAEEFVGAEPFSGYDRYLSELSPVFDVSRSPIWPVIERAALLMRLLRGQGPEG